MGPVSSILTIKDESTEQKPSSIQVQKIKFQMGFRAELVREMPATKKKRLFPKLYFYNCKFDSTWRKPSFIDQAEGSVLFLKLKYVQNYEIESTWRNQGLALYLSLNFMFKVELREVKYQQQNEIKVWLFPKL